MNYNDRRHFFRYTTAETARLNVDSRKLRWSSPLLFNDPFDYQTGFAFPFCAVETVPEGVEVQSAISQSELLLETAEPLRKVF
jgi:hypothetical protein